MKLTLVVLILTGIIGFLYSAPADTVEKQIQDRQYQSAISLLKSEKDDYSLFLTAKCYFYLKNYSACLEKAGDLIKKFPKSQWLSKTYYLTADCYTAQKFFDKAYQIYNNRLSNIQSSDRRKFLRQFYIDLSKSFADKENPTYDDYSKAIKLLEYTKDYDDLIDTDWVDYQIGELFYKEKYYSDSVVQLKKFALQYTNSGYLENAYYTLCLSYLSNNNYFDARESLITLSKWKNGKYNDFALYQLARSYLAFFYNLDSRETGVSLMKSFIKKYPGAEYITNAWYDIPNSFYTSGQYKLCIEPFKEYASRFPESENAGLSLKLAGLAYLQLNKRDDALKTWKDFLSRFTSHPEWKNVQTLLLNTCYDDGYKKYNSLDLDGAMESFQYFLKNYPTRSCCIKRSPKNILIIANPRCHILRSLKSVKNSLKTIKARWAIMDRLRITLLNWRLIRNWPV